MSASTLVRRLQAHSLTLSVAESCTGGMLGQEITKVPGCSSVFEGGIVSYSDRSKSKVLGIKKRILKNGSVSAATAEAMAHGVKKKFGTNIGIGITGIAGPTGGSEQKPKGTVWLSIVGPEHLVIVHRENFKGSRQATRKQAVDAALKLLAQALDEAELEGIIERP